MNKVCRMGENYAFIKPNGDVERCCKDHSLSLGNVIKGTFKLLEQAITCDIKDCYCWRRMLVGTEEKWINYWNGTWDQFYSLKMEEVLHLVRNKTISYGEGILKIKELTLKIKILSPYMQRINQIKHDIICAYLLDGYKFINNNSLNEAKVFIEQLIKNFSKDMLDDTFLHAYIYIVRIYMSSHSYEKAKEYINIAKKYNSRYPSLYKLSAMIYFELKDYNNCKLMFVKSIIYAKKDKNYKELSEIYYEMSVCFEKYCKLNRNYIQKSKYLKIMTKILNKSKIYDTYNLLTTEKIKRLKSDFV